jgi:hypothetical protein
MSETKNAQKKGCQNCGFPLPENFQGAYGCRIDRDKDVVVQFTAFRGFGPAKSTVLWCPHCLIKAVNATLDAPSVRSSSG